jgi:hypothetical protein
MMIDPLQGWRTVNVTGQHISRNIAGRVRLLADEDYPKSVFGLALLAWAFLSRDKYGHKEARDRCAQTARTRSRTLSCAL